MLKVFCLWSTIQKIFRKYKVFWLMLVDFNLTLCLIWHKIPCLKLIYLQIQAASRIEVAICFFYFYFYYFSTWVFFHEHSRFTGQQRKGEGIYLTPLYHFHPLHRHLDISRAITAESSPLCRELTCFFYGAPFYRIKCSKSFLLCRIGREQCLSFLVLVFHH